MLVLCGQRQKLLRGRIVDDLFREGATPGDLDKKIDPLTADLVRQPRCYERIVYKAQFCLSVRFPTHPTLVCRLSQGETSPRIILTSDFGHASRAKGRWPDPARVIRNSPRAGPLVPSRNWGGRRRLSSRKPLQTNSGSILDSRISSPQRSALISTECAHL